MKKIKSIVVDDEQSNRKLIINLINKLNPNFEIVGEASDIQSAYELINVVKPKVVFLDIRMPGGTGFELLEMFEEFLFDVVFISGFDSYALKAFEFNALDYVLKPINNDKFSKTLNKIQHAFENKIDQGDSLKNVLDSFDTKQSIMTRIPIHSGKMVRILSIEDMNSIKSQDGCTFFSMNNGERFTSSKQFSDFEFILERSPFMIRINKSVFININRVIGYTKGVICEVTLSDGSIFEISRRKKSEVLELLSHTPKSY